MGWNSLTCQHLIAPESRIPQTWSPWTDRRLRSPRFCPTVIVARLRSGRVRGTCGDLPAIGPGPQMLQQCRSPESLSAQAVRAPTATSANESSGSGASVADQMSPQHSSRPSLRRPHAGVPASTSTNAPSAGSTSSWPLPQHVTDPSSLIPHELKPAADTYANFPLGASAWPNSLFPQHRTALSIRSAHACEASLRGLEASTCKNWPSGMPFG